MTTALQFLPLRQAAIASGLRRCALLADCSPTVLDEVVAITRVRRLNAGETLFHDGDAAEGFFVVQSGAIKLHRGNGGSRDLLLHVFRPWESFGEEAVVSDTGYLASARALEASQVLVVPKAGFLALLRRHSCLSLHLLQSLGQRFHQFVMLLDDLRLKDVSTRVALWCLEQCPAPASSQPNAIHLHESKRVLAAELGTCSETLSRTLARFRDQRLLSIRGRTVTVLCPRRLGQWTRDEVHERPTVSPGGGWLTEPADRSAGAAELQIPPRLRACPANSV